MAARLAEHKCVSDWRELNYVCGPDDGPPLVLLHGVMRRWQDFMPLIPSLAERWRVFGLDFRGHGKSDRVEDGYLTVQYTHDAKALLENDIQGPAVVFGHSLGAMVAADVAAEMPDRVRALILEDPPFDTMGARIAQTWLLNYFIALRQLAGTRTSVTEYAQALADVRFGPPGKETSMRLGDLRDETSLRFSASCLMQLDPHVLDPIVECRWLEGYDLNSIMSRIKCPVLVLQADPHAGGMLAHKDAAEFQTRLADCTKVDFPGAGHLIHWTETEKTLRHVTGFLESLGEQ